MKTQTKVAIGLGIAALGYYLYKSKKLSTLVPSLAPKGTTNEEKIKTTTTGGATNTTTPTSKGESQLKDVIEDIKQNIGKTMCSDGVMRTPEDCRSVGGSYNTGVAPILVTPSTPSVTPSTSVVEPSTPIVSTPVAPTPIVPTPPQYAEPVVLPIDRIIKTPIEPIRDEPIMALPIEVTPEPYRPIHQKPIDAIFPPFVELPSQPIDCWMRPELCGGGLSPIGGYKYVPIERYDYNPIKKIQPPSYPSIPTPMPIYDYAQPIGGYDYIYEAPTPIYKVPNPISYSYQEPIMVMTDSYSSGGGGVTEFNWDKWMWNNNDMYDSVRKLNDVEELM